MRSRPSVPELRVYVSKETFESFALLSLERTQLPSFANGVFGSYGCLFEFLGCHITLRLGCERPRTSAISADCRHQFLDDRLNAVCRIGRDTIGKRYRMFANVC